MEKGFISASKAIKGYTESMIAKSENNDCVVRAIASASEMDYNSAHQFVKETFNRENGRPTFGFGTGMNLLSKNGKPIPCTPISFYYSRVIIGIIQTWRGKLLQVPENRFESCPDY